MSGFWRSWALGSRGDRQLGEPRAGHGAESQAAKRFAASAGAGNVKRMHFHSLQHNKVLIAKQGGKAQKVLFGSTNFSFRGIYIQANNALVFQSPDAAGLFESAFELAFNDPSSFETNAISTKWQLLPAKNRPPVHFCFSPHSNPDLSLSPLAAAIDQATSSVFFAIAFLNQTAGPTRDAINRLMTKNVFSYGISDHASGLKVTKPDGSVALWISSSCRSSLPNRSRPNGPEARAFTSTTSSW